MKELGTLKSVPVRDFWNNEPLDFTPWLAEEPNLALLGQAIGLELEVEGLEVAVGPYSADILARETSTGGYVVIENQLAKTNHDHLGKAITYASVLDASTIIWIASRFTEEHKKALDWLNDNSTSDIAYYGIHLELWQIADSLPAVRFNVISRPAEVARSTVVSHSTELSPVKELQLNWWRYLRERLDQQHVVPSTRSPRPQYWYNIALGRTGIHLSAMANTYKNYIGLRVYMRDSYNASAALAQLLSEREVIEREIGQKLLWDANPSARDKTIAIKHTADLNNRDKWPEYRQWQIDMIDRFYRSFSHRVRQLNLEDEEMEE
ncbi:MAG: DUF4268 domain-containing protein [Anaerolineae bacterium]|nr:DUF4268 domain-containing protein [Anaerolineae bacterium]